MGKINQELIGQYSGVIKLIRAQKPCSTNRRREADKTNFG